jgi:hypothetical protein
VVFDDGLEVLAGGEHQWVTITRGQRKGYFRRDRPRDQHRGPRPDGYPLDWARWGAVRDTDEIASTLLAGDGGYQHAVPVASPLRLGERDLPVDPYLLGVWLGDGGERDGVITAGFDPDDPMASGAEFTDRCLATHNTCPGRPVRVRQWEQVLLPAFLRREESNDLGTFEGFSGNGRDSFQTAVRRAVDVVMSQGLTGSPSGAVRAWAKQLDDLHGADANTADVDTRVRDQLRAGFGGVHPDATTNQVRPSQEWLVETLLDIQSKLDRLLGPTAEDPGSGAGDTAP